VTEIDKTQLSELVRKVLAEVLSDKVTHTEPVLEKKPTRNLAQENIARWLGHSLQKTQTRNSTALKLPIITSQDDAKAKTQTPSDNENLIPNPRKPEKLTAALEHSPARLGVWRAGTRYLTSVALKLRADHAIAKDAVYAEMPAHFAEKNNWVPLTTKATNKEKFLLRPDLGRQLDDKSLLLVREKAIKNPDIQITVADGLSSWAAERFAPAMVAELQKLFSEAKMTVGTIYCVRFSRIAVQDVIGEAVGAKVSMILLGERPGLGTGDSLSNYMIYGPKVGTVNANKSMISNIHATGHTPIDAARLTFSMVKKMFEQGCSGVKLKI